VQPNDLPLAVGVHRDGDYRCDRDDPTAFSLLQIGRVQPQIGPFARQGAVKERPHSLIDVLAQLGDLRLADPR
jgi:hypothetical protein